MVNRVKAPVEVVETYHLKLDIGHHLDLSETLYVPSLSRNLVSLSKLDATRYSFNFGNECFSLSIIISLVLVFFVMVYIN